jgi:hypothetical protein
MSRSENAATNQPNASWHVRGVRYAACTRP